jgi:hypothetical protein
MTDAATLSQYPKWLNDANSEMVGLWVESTTAGHGTSIPWQASSGSQLGNIFQVPADKIFHILHISHTILESGATVNKIKLWQSATSTGVDHARAVFSGENKSSDQGCFQSIPVNLTIEANEYVTITCETSAGYYGQIIGVLTDV